MVDSRDVTQSMTSSNELYRQLKFHLGWNRRLLLVTMANDPILWFVIVTVGKRKVSRVVCHLP